MRFVNPNRPLGRVDESSSDLADLPIDKHRLHRMPAEHIHPCVCGIVKHIEQSKVSQRPPQHFRRDAIPLGHQEVRLASPSKNRACAWLHGEPLEDEGDGAAHRFVGVQLEALASPDVSRRRRYIALASTRLIESSPSKTQR